MSLVEFLYVDRSLSPTAATGTTSLPRNAQLLMKFSEEVDPNSVTNQTIQIRSGVGLIPLGSFSVNGNLVRFDPTVTSQGQPNPFGFDPEVQYTVYVPSHVDQVSDNQVGVVQNRDADPNQTTFRTSFATSAGYLRELQPPRVLEVFFEPAPEVLTGNIPGNGRMGILFSEPMDPATFVLGPQALPLDAPTTVDVRYDPLLQVNIDALLAGTAIAGSFTHDPSATVFHFNPFFSFGDRKLVFYVQVLQGLRDLAGNQLVNPRSFGNYTCDGHGLATGKLLTESFDNTLDADLVATDAIWGAQVVGTLQGQPVTSRVARTFGYREAGNNGSNPDSGRGQYAPLREPLIGAALNDIVPNVTPPTNQGRRSLLAFHDYEVGASGTITAAAWGPDGNATVAALYQSIFLRMGYQATASMSLAPTFSGNYSGTPQVVFHGDYQVAQSTVANTAGEPAFGHIPGYQEGQGCVTGGFWNLPLFTSTGFYPWPAFTTNFEWNAGTAANDDVVFLFDVSVPEGDTWQTCRTWFASTFPCSLNPIGGYPQRHLRSTYESDTPNPTADVANNIYNPEPRLYDMAFTVTKQISIAQSLFYTDPAHPMQAAGGNTFGDLSDYRVPVLTPATQAGGAKVEFYFQGADAVANDRRTINQAAPFTGWTKDINDCVGMRCLRWQLRLITNLQSGEVAKVTKVQIPVASL
jgi:hypothetical protein